MLSKRKIIFVCFATRNLVAERNRMIEDAQELDLFDSIEFWDERRLQEQPEYLSLPDVVKAGNRGYGYFWWKPFIIRKTMDTMASGDLVFYSDCGRYDGGFRLGSGAAHLIDRYKDSGFVGVEVPQFGPSERWTRWECFKAFAGDDGGLEARLRKAPQIQATFSLWKHAPAGREALDEWEAGCRVPHLVCDISELERGQQCDGFVEHRYDQSIVSLVARRRNLPYIALAGKFQGILLRLFRNTHVGNVDMKKTQFVADAMRNNGVIYEMLKSCLRRAQRKLTSQRI